MIGLIISILIALGIIGSNDEFYQLDHNQQQEYIDNYTAQQEEIITDLIEAYDGGN